MGLILSKQIVQHMGGKLDFSSEYKVGSTFVFSFNLDICDGIQHTEEKAVVGNISPNFGRETAPLLYFKMAQECIMKKDAAAEIPILPLIFNNLVDEIDQIEDPEPGTPKEIMNNFETEEEEKE